MSVEILATDCDGIRYELLSAAHQLSVAKQRLLWQCLLIFKTQLRRKYEEFNRDQMLNQFTFYERQILFSQDVLLIHYIKRMYVLLTCKGNRPNIVQL